MTLGIKKNSNESIRSIKTIDRMKINGKYQTEEIVHGNNIPSHRNPPACPPKGNSKKIFKEKGVEMIENNNEIILTISGHGGLVKDALKFYEHTKSLKKSVIVKFKIEE